MFKYTNKHKQNNGGNCIHVDLSERGYHEMFLCVGRSFCSRTLTCDFFSTLTGISSKTYKMSNKPVNDEWNKKENPKK